MNSDANSVWGNEATQHFTALEPNQILRIAEEYGVKCTGRILQLNSMENRVYQLEIEVDDNSLALNHPDRFRIVKFYRPGRWSYEQILEEHQFLEELVNEEYPVVAPIKYNNDLSIVKDDQTGLFACMFPRIGGRNVDELRNDQIQIVGRLLARLHTIGARKEAAHRLKLNCNTYGDQNLDLILSFKMIPHQLENIYIDLVEELLDMIEPLFEGVDFQRIHGDCHLGNILDGASGLFLVDFDDMIIGPPVQDIWLVEGGGDDYSIRRRNMLLESYSTFKNFDNKTLNLIEPLRTLRLIHFSAWIGKRYSDPSFKKAYPDYGSQDYWQEQISTLREQADLISAL